MGPHSAVTGAPSLLCCRLRMRRCALLRAWGPWKGDSPLPSPSSFLSDPGSQRARFLHHFWGPAQTLAPGVLKNSSPKGSASHGACGTWTEFSGVKALPSYNRRGSRAAQLIRWQVAPRKTPGLVLMPFHLNRPGTADLPAWSFTRACVGGQRGAEGRLGGRVWADGGAAGSGEGAHGQCGEALAQVSLAELHGAGGAGGLQGTPGGLGSTAPQACSSLILHADAATVTGSSSAALSSRFHIYKVWIITVLMS